MATFLQYQNGQLIASSQNVNSSAIRMNASAKRDFFQFDNKDSGNKFPVSFIDDVIVMGLMLAITIAIL
jgi:hypothetical protein